MRYLLNVYLLAKYLLISTFVKIGAYSLQYILFSILVNMHIYAVNMYQSEYVRPSVNMHQHVLSLSLSILNSHSENSLLG